MATLFEISITDGYGYLSGSFADESPTDWTRFISDLYENILNVKYPRRDNSFEIPITKVARHKFRRQQVPEIFLTDL